MTQPTNEFIVAVLRTQAWERVKGEMQAVLVTYHSADMRFLEIYELFHTLIRKVEDKGLQE